MNPEVLGARLRAARDNRGLSQEAVAAALGIGRPAVSLIESGKRGVSTLELTKLANLLGYTVSALVADSGATEDVLVTLFRLSPGLAEADEVRGEVAKIVELFRMGADLRQRLGFGQQLNAPSYPLAAPSSVMDAVAQGRRVAADERRRLGLGNAPVSDLESLLLEQGIWVASSSLPDAVSGLFLADPSLGLAILVNAGQVRWRQRFSLAHEYAHALMDRDRQVTVSESSNGGELCEKRANAFAAAFLVPAEGVREQLQLVAKAKGSAQVPMLSDEGEPAPGARPRLESVQPYDVASLAHHFGVSYQTMVFQLLNANAVSRGEADRLKGSEGAGVQFLRTLKMWDAIEGKSGDRLDRDLKEQLARLVLEAYRQELVSRGKLLELARAIGVPGRDLLEIAEAGRDDNGD